MTERARRTGGPNHQFALPVDYELRLVLCPGDQEAFVAEFERIVDVPAALGLPAARAGASAYSGGRAPAPVMPPRPRPAQHAPTRPRARVAAGSATPRRAAAEVFTPTAPIGDGDGGSGPGGQAYVDLDELTALDELTQIPEGSDDLTICPTDDRTSVRGTNPAGPVLVLSLDGQVLGQQQLTADRESALVGRGSGCRLRCPSTHKGISRLHAEIIYADGRVYVEDKHSSNGTWIKAPGRGMFRLIPGEPVAIGRGTTVALDQDYRATVMYR